MKNIWNEISNTKSMLAIVGAIITIFIQAGFKVDIEYITELTQVVCYFLVLIGIFNKNGMDTPKWNK